jgi:hypothetical protein
MKFFQTVSLAALFILASLPAHADSNTKDKFYGALAYDTVTGVYGLSDSQPDKESARQDALSRCRDERGVNCQISGQFWKVCVAVATGNDKNFAFAYGDDMSKETSSALRQCQKHDKDNSCRVPSLHCYKPD